MAPETLDGAQIRDIIENGRMSNPPSSPSRPLRSPEPPPLKQGGEQGTTIAPDFPPGLTGAPA